MALTKPHCLEVDFGVSDKRKLLEQLITACEGDGTLRPCLPEAMLAIEKRVQFGDVHGRRGWAHQYRVARAPIGEALRLINRGLTWFGQPGQDRAMNPRNRLEDTDAKHRFCWLVVGVNGDTEGK